MKVTSAAVKAFLLRSAAVGVLAALAFAGANVQDVGVSGESAALGATIFGYAANLVHALTVKYGLNLGEAPPLDGP